MSGREGEGGQEGGIGEGLGGWEGEEGQEAQFVGLGVCEGGEVRGRYTLSISEVGMERGDTPW